MQTAFTPTTDARLVEVFHNAHAVVDPGTQDQLQQLFDELGPELGAQLQPLVDLAHNALIDGVRLGYVMALVLSVIIMGLVLFIRTPNYRAAENQQVELPSHESAVEIVYGALMLATLGGLGVWWLYDLIIVVAGDFRDAEGRRVSRWDPEVGDFHGTEALAQDVDALRAEVSELAERLDFAERLLARPRDLSSPDPSGRP
jgi:hypothetical protein